MYFCLHCKCNGLQGIQFDAERLLDLGLDPATLYPHCLDRSAGLRMEDPSPPPSPSAHPDPGSSKTGNVRSSSIEKERLSSESRKGKGSMEKDPLEFEEVKEVKT